MQCFSANISSYVIKVKILIYVSNANMQNMQDMHRDGWNHVKFVLYTVCHQVYLYYMDKTGRVGGEGPGGWALEVK